MAPAGRNRLGGNSGKSRSDNLYSKRTRQHFESENIRAINKRNKTNFRMKIIVEYSEQKPFETVKAGVVDEQGKITKEFCFIYKTENGKVTAL